MEIEFESLSIKHLDGLIDVWGDKEVIKYTNIKNPLNREDAEKRIKRLSVHEVFVAFKDGELVGGIGCPCESKEDNVFGLFYMFKKSVWNKGIASYCAKWILSYMKRQYKSATIYADVVAENIASEKILVNNGFILEGIRKQEFIYDNKKIDIKSYLYRF